MTARGHATLRKGQGIEGDPPGLKTVQEIQQIDRIGGIGCAVPGGADAPSLPWWHGVDQAAGTPPLIGAAMAGPRLAGGPCRRAGLHDIVGAFLAGCDLGGEERQGRAFGLLFPAQRRTLAGVSVKG